MRGSVFRALASAAAVFALAGAAAAQTDLDTFMNEVLAQRDDNWKKLQQYILDERAAIDMTGPGRVPIWGDRREYTWFVRDGFFVRSPVKFNGVTIGESDRRKYEADFLARVQRRDSRRRGDPPDEPQPPADVEGLLRQTRAPDFVSSAYFLRFRFEEGKYALVGREPLDGRDVLKIEYYPTKLFRGTDRRRRYPGCVGANCDVARDEEEAYDAAFRRLMNKTALVTLWIEPTAHQIVKYTFDNIALDFLPAQWLVHMDELHASMTMSQPFPDVWLPNALEARAALSLAVGQFEVRYGLEYHDYRRADVTTKVTVPKAK